MIIEARQQIGCRISRHKKKKKKRVSRILFLLVSCFIFFNLGQDFIYAVQASSGSLAEVTTSGNKIQTENVNAVLQENKNEWNLILINPWNRLPDNFNIELTKLKNGQAVDKRIYPDLQAMLDDARANGLSPVICSSFRTMEKQQSLFDNQVNKYILRGYSTEQAKMESGKWVAVPGTSEHQLGLAVDIVATSYQSLDKQQEKTAEQQWLIKNCYKYGFILRYPSNKSELTGISYEPWHYRYVGKEAAKQIMDKGICLEEYLQSL